MRTGGWWMSLLAAGVLVAGCSSSQDAASGGSSTTAVPASPGASTTQAPAGLPMGDGKHTSAPARGSVFSCQRFDAAGGGAFRDGPWIDAAAGTWDPAAKIAVRGSVDRHGTVTWSPSGGGAVVSGNGLPTVPTGVFPVAADDPAYQYDRNPNTIAGYRLAVNLPAPAAAGSPTCVGGTIGVSVLGVPIFSAFDALGRDAAAHEVQDACGGHPERTGQYHYHSLSSCWKDAAGFEPGLFGYALDGFGIYVERDAAGNLPRSADLDECHGRTGEVVWHGQKVSMYHYVATADFPYLVGCYRGTPITSATGLRLGAPPAGGPGGRPPGMGPPPP
ncbi:MAG TPA: YHYH protein [Acidimicrobiales bacterium]|nr:YHYH protein [Acidimicrobiales bacterium]